MNARYHILLLSMLFGALMPSLVKAQQGGSLFQQRKVSIPTNVDTIRLDSLSIVPSSISFAPALSPGLYDVLASEGLFVWQTAERPTGVEVSFRVFPVSFSTPLSNKTVDMIRPGSQSSTNPFRYKGTPPPSDEAYELYGLNKVGSISRGISFGNNQDLGVNSNLNLQVSGRLSENLFVQASISDQNIPIQPEGNTQQLQDFDQVYIKLFNDDFSLTAGDFQQSNPTNSHYLKYFKRSRGALASTGVQLNENTKYNVEGGAAVSRGKFSRNVVQGVEGNQGPYRLKGNQNEPFIVILSGTERVYIDGKLLTRGQDNDYVINYNTAEITFTAKQLITKDKRIIVEFQYSDQNYARSLFTLSNQITSDKVTANINYYTEQDHKGQPLQQELSDDQKLSLRNAGDQPSGALVNSVQPVDFNENQVLYNLVDTAGYDSILVYSAIPNGQLYRAIFTNVGQGNGNYTVANVVAGGRVYQWVAPNALGEPQGEFEPVAVLIAPKKQQMVSADVHVKVNKNNTFQYNVAVSQQDQNTFSNLDKADNVGLALKGDWENSSALLKRDTSLRWIKGASYEFWHRNFSEVERVRTVEFYRDWNLRNDTLRNDQNILTLRTGLQKGAQKMVYSYGSFLAGSQWDGSRHELVGNFNKNGWAATADASLMNADGFNERSRFFRHKVDVSKSVGVFKFGYRDDREENEQYQTGLADSLTPFSYKFWEHEYYIANADTTKNKFKLFYIQRRDYAPEQERLLMATYGESVGFQMELVKNKNSKLRTRSTYRRLTIPRGQLTTEEPENSFLNRVDYSVRLWKGAVVSSSFIELGSGLENKREFTFIEVQAGQGQYTWVDYNDNRVKDINEFEVAVFQDQANYVKVFVPTSEYVQTFTNQFNQMIFIKPEVAWRNQTGIRKFLARFSNQAAYRMDKKTDSIPFLDLLNPSQGAIVDSQLISLNSSFRNTFYFNRTHPVYGAHINIQDIRNKTLLTNGFEARVQQMLTYGARWNVTKKITLEGTYTDGTKESSAALFANRNYKIDYQTMEPKFTYQPNKNFRWSVTYTYSYKKNVHVTELGERAIINDGGVSLRWNAPRKGSVEAGANFVQIQYSGLTTTTTLAYEMLNGLKDGANTTWNLSYQQTLANNVQLSIGYNGRSSPGTKVIHNGTVSARAFF